MAWHFAVYAEAVAAAGRAEHDLPLFVNAALIRPGRKPGEYPSAGPLPQVFDVWRAGAPTIVCLPGAGQRAARGMSMDRAPAVIRSS